VLVHARIHPTLPARARHRPIVRHRCVFWALWLSALSLAAPDARAYRPFDGTDAAVAKEGAFELELGPAHFYSEAGHRYVIEPATVLNLGFARGFELVADFKQFVGVDTVPDQARVRLLDTDILVKWVLRRGILQGERGVSVALESGLLLPEIQGVSQFGAQADLIVSYRWPAFALHLNEQAALSRRGNLDLFSGAILEGPGDWDVRPVAEVFVEREFNVNATYSALLGGICDVNEDFALDVGLRGALIGGQRAEEVRFGFTWSLPLWRPTTVSSRAQ
jgi:hypothetical protein